MIDQHLLASLMSQDNIRRKHAEVQLSEQLEKDLISTVQSLLMVFADASFDLVLRSFAGILLRTAIEKNTNKLNAELIVQIRNILLNVWTSESNAIIFRRLSHLLAQLSVISQWSELIPFLISQNQSKDIIPLLELVEIISDYSPENIQTNLNSLGPFLGQHIMSNDSRIQVACARATCACIVCLEDENHRNSFRSALSPIMTVLSNCLNTGNEIDATNIIDHLVTIANIQPVFFKGSVDNIIGAMLSIANSSALEFSTRSIAIELIVTLTETAPALARRCEGLASGLCPIAFSFMIQRDETENEWCGEKYTDEPVDGDFTIGEEAIERIAAGAGGRIVAPEVLKLAESFSCHISWKYRRAAVASVNRLAEGCPQYFEKNHLSMSKQFLMKMIVDPSPIVKYEVIQTIGRFASLFSDDIKNMIATFLPPLVVLLADATQCERVRGHAVAALISLADPEYCEEAHLKPYLDSLLTALLSCIQTASINVQPSCLILIGGVAKVVDEGFAPYYSTFMPGIKMMLTQALAPDMATLRGRAMECVGLLGEAVGVEVFANDALEVMNTLIHAMEVDMQQQNNSSSNSGSGGNSDMTFEYILPACARISKALESRFEPFLPLVMGPLLAGAIQVIQFSMEDADEEDQEGEVSRNEDTGLESTVISLGAGIKKKVTLNTTAVQQKHQAARMLFEFAKSLKGYLKAYLIPSITALLNMITDKHSADVRSSACLALAKMFEAYLHASQCKFVQAESLPEVLAACLGKLLEGLKGEISCTTRACAAESLRDILAACYNSGTEAADGSHSSPLCAPSLSISADIAKELLSLCGAAMSRKQTKEKEFESNEGLEAEDRDAYADELEEEEETMSNLVDAIGQLLKLHGGEFMPVFDQAISTAFAPYLSPTQPVALQILAVCMIDDAIEFGGVAAHKYIAQVLPILLHNITTSDNHILRQCSTYGIAQALRFAPEICAPQLSILVPTLMKFVLHPSGKEEDNEGATENVIYALGTIYHHQQYREVSWGGVEPTQLASLWLQSLPLRADESEAKIAHSQLCDAIEKNDVKIVGNNYSNLSELLRIMAEIFLDMSVENKNNSNNNTSCVDVNTTTTSSNSCSLAHASTIQRMQNIIRQVVGTGSGLNQDLLMRAMQSLTINQQQIIQSVL